MHAEKGTNLTEAIQLIQQALALEPDNGYFVDSLGWAYYQQGRYVEALRELKRAVSLAKEDPVLYEHLGDAYLKNNLSNEAIEAWEKSLKVDPEGPTATQVKDKIRETRESRAKGVPPKAEQK